MFLILVTELMSDIFVFESISIVSSDPQLDGEPTVNSGPTESDLGHRFAIAV